MYHLPVSVLERHAEQNAMTGVDKVLAYSSSVRAKGMNVTSHDHIRAPIDSSEVWATVSTRRAAPKIYTRRETAAEEEEYNIAKEGRNSS